MLSNYNCNDGTCIGTPQYPCGIAQEKLPAFEAAADAGFETVRATFTGRGQTYGDSWGMVPGLYDEDERRLDVWALMRVKMMRILYTKGTHRDSVVDLIAYACAMLQWNDEGAVGEEW